MIKFISKIVFLTLTLTCLTFAQTDSISEFLNGGKKAGQQSFANIDRFLAKNNKDFDNSDEVVNLFNQERDRLGSNFETELWKYLGNNLAKHYWISGFVEDDYYLQGNKSMPQLAFKIREKGVELPVANDDYPGLGNKFTMLRDMAVYLYLDGNHKSAITQKKKAEVIYKEIKDYGVVGATTEYVMCIYDNLEKNPNSCKEKTVTKARPATYFNLNSETFSGGVLNGKAINLPAPEYPAAAKAVGATGTVNVSVVVDETGNVTSAEVKSGHPLLKAEAVKAAQKAMFQPFLMNGKAVKVTGIIVYNFSK